MPDVLLAPNNSNYPWPDALKFERIYNVNSAVKITRRQVERG